MSRPPELWLPALDRFDPAGPLRRALVRADRAPDGAPGYLGGLAERFDTGRGGIPAAALIRQHAAGDAAGQLWLAADPAWVEPDLNGARLLACGHLGLSLEQARALAAPLHDLLAESGLALEVTTPDRWQLRLPPGTTLPDLPSPEQALGDDLIDYLPRGAEARRWRLLLTELQVLLHQQPLNAQRRGQGLPPVNSVWLWGGGTLPERVHTAFAGVMSDDALVAALAACAERPLHARDADALAALPDGWLVDLQDLPAEAVEQVWWPAVAPLLPRRALAFGFAGGQRWIWQPRHRLRFWRRGEA